MKNIEIRQAIEEDFEEIRKIEYQGFELHSTNAPWNYDKKADSFSREKFVEIILNDDITMLVVEHEGNIVGFSIFSDKQTDNVMMVNRKYVMVEFLAIDSRARRQGFAQELMLEIENIAKGKGISEIQLEVWDFNVGAKNLYKKSGYNIYGHKLVKHL